MADTNPQTLDIGGVLTLDENVQRTTNSTGFGITEKGFIAKPFAQLLTEKLSLAQSLFGADIDITSGSSIRKILEISALEEARMWSALGAAYDNSYVVTATGEALSRLGAELGFSRPHMEARGKVTFTLSSALPPGYATLSIPRGARLVTSGGHQVATESSATFTAQGQSVEIDVVAFYPGPEHNLDPAFAVGDQHPQLIVDFAREQDSLEELVAAETANHGPLVSIKHTSVLTGGETYWSDARFRQLLLRAPRSVWTIQAIELAVSLVPGVRQVRVHDGRGGLDLNQSIFGNFNFIERVFSAERDLGSPYYFNVLVAPTPAAIWDGPTGLRKAVETVIEDLRPVGIFPNVESAAQIGIGIQGQIVVNYPLPSGTSAVVNASQGAKALKARIYELIRRYIDALPISEPVRHYEISYAIMSDPAVVDVRNLSLVKYPPGFDEFDLTRALTPTQVQVFAPGQNVALGANQVAVFIDNPNITDLVIV